MNCLCVLAKPVRCRPTCRLPLSCPPSLALLSAINVGNRYHRLFFLRSIHLSISSLPHYFCFVVCSISRSPICHHWLLPLPDGFGVETFYELPMAKSFTSVMKL